MNHTKPGVLKVFTQRGCRMLPGYFDASSFDPLAAVEQATFERITKSFGSAWRITNQLVF